MRDGVPAEAPEKSGAGGERKSAVCLLTHGYLGTPFEMEPLVEPLLELGADVRMVTLPGHDSTLEEFRKTGYRVWYEHVEREYLRAAEEYEKVFLIGFSLGGSLSLAVAEKHSPAGVAAISSPVLPVRVWPRQMRDWGLVFLPLLRFFVKEMALRPARPESRAIAPWRGYEAVAHPPQLYSLFKGLGGIRRNLYRISSPLLVVHDVRDRVISCGNAMKILEGVSSERARARLLRVSENVTSHHTITTHRESRALVQREVCLFVAEAMEMDVFDARKCCNK